MATKNNFSKAVMDLMGLPGNDDSAAEKSINADDQGIFENVEKIETKVDFEKENDSELEIERRKFLYSAKPVTNVNPVNTMPVQAEIPATVISRTMVIVGEITSSGDIDVYGDVKGSIKTSGDIKATGKIVGDIAGKDFNLNGCTVQGNINAQGNVIIGINTIVVGDISAENIKVNGKVKGNIKITNTSEFLESALLVGDVSAQTISMNQGAKLHGNVSVSLDSGKGEKEFDSIFGM